MDTGYVLQIALRVRKAIESVQPQDLPITFSHFPRGACGDASLLLGTYFEESCGLPPFEYICGERGTYEQDNWTSHAWLQRGDLVVDITADQFFDAPAPVIVAAPSIWHLGFEIESKHVSNLRKWSGGCTHEVLQFYARIQRTLEDDA